MTGQKTSPTEKNNIATRNRLRNWGVVTIQTPKGVFKGVFKTSATPRVRRELRGNLLQKKHKAHGPQQVSANGERYGESIAMTVVGEGDCPADMIHINIADEQFMTAQKS